MWIIPSNHYLHSPYATDRVASIEDLKEELKHYRVSIHKEKHLSDMPLLWRSNHLEPKMWLRRWKTVYWLRALFGRTLKHSRTKNFTEKYTSSLEDIHASHFHKPGYRVEPPTHDTYSHSLNMESTQLDLFSASSKMSPTTSTSDSEKSDKEYQALVTKLKRTYSLRRTWARHILESVYSSLLWPTPTGRQKIIPELYRL